MAFGVDYASVDENSRPKLALTKAKGLRFAIVRGSYSTWADPACARDRDAIRSAGLVFGAYLFPVTNLGAPTPEDQVHAFLENAELIPGIDFAPIIDLEWPRGISATGRSRSDLAYWIARARAAVKFATGVEPIIYSSARVLDGHDDDAMAGAADHAIAGCPAWCARYALGSRLPAVIDAHALDSITSPPVPRALGDSDAWWIHQYQGDAVGLLGFSSTVDVDRFHLLTAGARGTRVAWMQRRLLMVEGAPSVWDATTEVELRAFQSANHLDVDGIVGPATFAALSWVRV